MWTCVFMFVCVCVYVCLCLSVCVFVGICACKRSSELSDPLELDLEAIIRYRNEIGLIHGLWRNSKCFLLCCYLSSFCFIYYIKYTWNLLRGQKLKYFHQIHTNMYTQKHNGDCDMMTMLIMLIVVTTFHVCKTPGCTHDV